MQQQDPGSTPVHALVIKTVRLLAASVVSIGFRAPYEDHQLKIVLVVALTAVALGLRDAAVRKLGVPDLTTTVLTLTSLGLLQTQALRAAITRLQATEDQVQVIVTARIRSEVFRLNAERYPQAGKRTVQLRRHADDGVPLAVDFDIFPDCPGI